jgi:hypothetical protein
VLIVASNVTVEHAFRISATKAFFKIEGTSSNVYNVTVSGTTCTVSSAATAAVFDAATFTEAPLIAQLGANDDLFVAIDAAVSGSTVRAQAVDCSGTTPSAGAAVNIVGSGGEAPIGIYRVTPTTALALYVDDSGTAGGPRSLRGVVLTLTGTTIAVGTSAGVNDIVAAVALPSVQLTSTSYVVGYVDNAGTEMRAVHVGVSGTTVIFGTPLLIEGSLPGFNSSQYNFTALNSNRFQPLLFRLSDTTVIVTYGDGSGGNVSRHVVITNSAGTLTAGAILYGLWTMNGGGNFPQASDGFLAINTASDRMSVAAVSISGTTLTQTGLLAREDVAFSSGSTSRFGLSGGVRGTTSSATRNPGLCHLFRFRSGAPPIYLGFASMNLGPSIRVAVELAPNRAAFTSLSTAQSGSTTAAVKLAILEFAA